MNTEDYTDYVNFVLDNLRDTEPVWLDIDWAEPDAADIYERSSF